MKRMVIIVVAAIVSLPAFAGESPYTGPGANTEALAATKSCQPKYNAAQRKMVFMPESDQRKSVVVRELQLANLAMSQGKAQECLLHVSKANDLEQ